MIFIVFSTILWADLGDNLCECDINQDGSCNVFDWFCFIEDWGRTDCSGNCECDLNSDGSCNVFDWFVFIEDWGRTDCPVIDGPLMWPIDCIPGVTCSSSIGYPDIDGDGLAFNCGPAGYIGHEGTDICITWEQMDIGVDVLAAADGEVLWVFDGKYDRCPNPDQPDC